MAGLTAKQERFLEEYLVDLNGTQAAIRAGYSPRSARVIANETLTKPAIRDRLAEVVAERSADLKLESNYVLRTVLETVERCRQAEPVLDKQGNPVFIDADGKIAGAYVFDAKNVLKGCELLGRRLGLFPNNLQVSDPDGRPFGSGLLDRYELARRAAYLLQNPGKEPIEGEATPA